MQKEKNNNQNHLSMEKYRKLLEEFQHIPRVEKKPPTFMEISGYPHFENVCSNILAFFFDTEQQHEFEDLFLKSLLSIIDPHGLEEDLNTINVCREKLTYRGNRIDLIIETEDMVIGIENKIWAPLHNDLEDYSSFLDSKYQNKKKRYKVILSLLPVPESKLIGGFVNISHNALLTKIKEGIVSNPFNNTYKHPYQLLDFIETIQNHYKTSTMNPETLDFFIQKKEIVETLLEEHRAIQQCIHEKLKRVQNIINQRIIHEKDIVLQKHRLWVWEKTTLACDLTLTDDLVIAVSSKFDIEGIGIKILVRKGNGHGIETLKKLKISESNPTIVGEQFIPLDKSEMKFNTSEDKIADTILEVLKKIHFTTENEVHLNSPSV